MKDSGKITGHGPIPFQGYGEIPAAETHPLVDLVEKVYSTVLEFGAAERVVFLKEIKSMVRDSIEKEMSRAKSNIEDQHAHLESLSKSLSEIE